MSASTIDRRALLLPRSLLYVPGHRSDLLAKAARSGADAVVADLEDAVPARSKDEARRAVGAWLDEAGEAAGVDAHEGTPRRWVRIPPEVADADLAAIDRPGLAGLMLAGCRAEGARRLESWFAGAATDCPVVGLVEDAAGLREVTTLAECPHLATVGVGEVDLLADLRMERSASGAVAALRLQVVVEAAAAGLAAPVAPTSTDFADLDAFRATTRDLVAAGFRSRTAVHPAQVAVINEVLTPSAEALAAARDVLERFAAADEGVTTDAQGRLIDLAVVRGATETLGRAAH